MKLFVSIQDAKDCGCTHEGYAFGVPVWLTEEYDDEVNLAPKFTPLGFWLDFADWLFEVVASVMPSDKELVSPIYRGRSIAEIERS